MNNWIKNTLGASAVGILIILATYGKQLAESGLALWLFFLDVAKAAPLGVASFAIALILAVSSRWFLRRWLPDLKCPLSRDFLIDLAALLTGIAVVWIQMTGVDSIERIKALWIGLVAGLMAPHVYNGLAALGGLIARSMSTPVEENKNARE